MADDEIGSLVIRVKTDKSGFETDSAAMFKKLETDASASVGRVESTLSSGLSSGLQSLQNQFGPVGSALGALGPAGIAAAAGFTALGVAAKAGVGEFTELAVQVAAFKRITGASAEDSSRLVAALNDVGISADAGAKAFAALARNADSKAFDATGVALAHTKTGAVDLVATFGNLITKVDGIADPVQRANVLTAALGKQAATLGPLFDKGAEGFKQLLKSNEGQILSDDDLKKARDFKAATDQLGDALKEVEIKIGRFVVPALTTLADIIAKFPTVLIAVGHAFEAFAQTVVDAADFAAGPWINFSDHIFAEKVPSGFAKATAAAIAFGDALEAQMTRTASDTDDATKALGALNDALGVSAATGLKGAAASLQTSIDAGKAAKALADGSVAVAKAKQNEADVSVSASRSIVAAQKAINAEIAKAPGLQAAVTRAQTDVAKAALAVGKATDSEAAAQKAYDQTIGRLPASIDDVTDALNRQIDAHKALDRLNANADELKDKIAADKEHIATLAATAPADQQAQLDQLTVAFHRAEKDKSDADKALARAQAGQSDDTDRLQKELSDPKLDPATKAQDQIDLAAAKQAALDSVSQLSDDATLAGDALTKSQNDLNQSFTIGTQAARDYKAALRELTSDQDALDTLTTRTIPAATNDAANADKNKVEVNASPKGDIESLQAVEGHPKSAREQAALDALQTAHANTASAIDDSAKATETLAGAEKDVTGNLDDQKTARDNLATVEAQAKKDRATAHSEYMTALAAEIGINKQAVADILTTAATELTERGKVKTLVDNTVTSYEKLLTSGAKVPDLTGLEALKTHLDAIGDKSDEQRIDALITKLTTAKGLQDSLNNTTLNAGVGAGSSSGAVNASNGVLPGNLVAPTVGPNGALFGGSGVFAAGVGANSSGNRSDLVVGSALTSISSLLAQILGATKNAPPAIVIQSGAFPISVTAAVGANAAQVGAAVVGSAYNSLVGLSDRNGGVLSERRH